LANARALAESLIDGCFPAWFLGGTDNAFCCCSTCFPKGLRGKEAEKALDRRAFHASQERHPVDTNPPLTRSASAWDLQPSPTRGFEEAEMRQVGALIGKAPQHRERKTIAAVRQKVDALTVRFPLYMEARPRSA